MLATYSLAGLAGCAFDHLCLPHGAWLHAKRRFRCLARSPLLSVEFDSNLLTASQVIAADSNEEQLRHAKPAQNVTYRHSDAHSMDLPDNCADLVTVASALHWLELPRFYRECRRVLKPHGCLAAWAIPLVRRTYTCEQRHAGTGFPSGDRADYLAQ